MRVALFRHLLRILRSTITQSQSGSGQTNNLYDEPVVHDGRRSLSSMLWSVAVELSGKWVPLNSISSRLTVLGTNLTGTFVTRTSEVAYGNYTGRFIIAYKALSSGPLKWDLDFTPNIPGHYAFVYSWLNTTSSNWLTPSLKQYRVGYGSENYTFSWADLRSTLNATSNVSTGSFSLRIDLDGLVSGERVSVDPSLVSSSDNSDATGYTFQRKLFFDSKAGRYWVFFEDNSFIWYSNSSDGLNWFPSKLLSISCCNTPDQQVSIYNLGEQILVAQGSGCSGVFPSGSGCTASLTYTLGSITGPQISWGSPLRPTVCKRHARLERAQSTQN